MEENTDGLEGLRERVQTEQRLREKARAERRAAAQFALIEEIGASGPEDLEQTVERAVVKIRLYRRGLRAIVGMSQGYFDMQSEIGDVASEVLDGKEPRVLVEWESTGKVWKSPMEKKAQPEVCVACDALLIGDQEDGGPLCPQCRRDAVEQARKKVGEGDWKDELGAAQDGVQDILASVRGMLHVIHHPKKLDTKEGGEKERGASIADAHVISTFMMGVMSKLHALVAIQRRVEELVEQRIVEVEERRGRRSNEQAVQ